MFYLPCLYAKRDSRFVDWFAVTVYTGCEGIELCVCRHDCQSAFRRKPVFELCVGDAFRIFGKKKEYSAV